MEISLWLVTILLALVCLRSGLMKLALLPGVESWVRDFARWGYPDWFRIVIGVAEVVSAVLLLVPRAASFGAGLFAMVMLGAIVTHATHGESSRLPFNFFLLLLSLAIAYSRRPQFLRPSIGPASGA
jgi:uncharacterized membrane protein YphA (DoxX/SURF4 family)